MLLNLDGVPDDIRISDLDRNEVGRPFLVRNRIELGRSRIDRPDRDLKLVVIGFRIGAVVRSGAGPGADVIKLFTCVIYECL